MNINEAQLLAEKKWNQFADEFNQWDSLSQDKKDKLIANAKQMTNSTVQRNDDLKAIVIHAATKNAFTPRFDYSGRYMNGKSCFGIVGSFANLAKFMVDVMDTIHVANDPDLIYQDFCHYFDNMQTDQMGKSDHIFYWPNLQISPINKPD